MLITPLPSELEHDAVQLWRDCGLTRPWNDPGADLGRALEGLSSTVLAAVTDGQLLGTVMAGQDGHRGWVYYLAVQPGHREAGIGRALMNAAESWLREQGIPKLQLMVRADNTAVIKFYERLGYVDQRVAVLGRFLDEELQALREQNSSERFR
ncbi:GNAT family acetyltransferase [Ornithinimicrobium sp. W1679]|uniref:GNAT family acetyltransferase n=1 Tax=Ornithinimicrobium sp. W1679 TaxID=3418770 RepID=UPI003CEC7C10